MYLLSCPKMGKVFLYGAVTLENSKEFVKQIEAEKKSLDVHINSPGGSVYGGFAIYNALQRKKNILSTYIDGIAYSAASWWALSADPDKRYMAEASQFGVHQAINGMGGNKDELQKQIDNLETLDEIQIEIFSKATSMGKDEIIDIMKQDKPLSFNEAQKFGFKKYEAYQDIAALFKLDNTMDLFEKMQSIFSPEDKTPQLIKEDVEKEAKDALKKAETVNDQLHAQFAGRSEVDTLKATLEIFVKNIVEKWDKLPTQKEIDISIEAKSKLAVLEALAAIKSKGSIPAPDETFATATKEAETFEPLTLKKNFFELKESIK